MEARVSPSTQRTASMMFDLPQPLMTTPTRLPGVSTVVGSTKVLNPASLSFARRTVVGVGDLGSWVSPGTGSWRNSGTRAPSERLQTARYDSIFALPADHAGPRPRGTAVNPDLQKLHPYPSRSSTVVRGPESAGRIDPIQAVHRRTPACDPCTGQRSARQQPLRAGGLSHHTRQRPCANRSRPG